MSEIDRSISRAYDAEAFRTDELGLAGSKMGRALTRKYLPLLCELIREQRLRARGRTCEPWKLLDMAEEELGLRLLSAGVTVCGTAGLAISRKHQRRTYLTTAHWIGLNLGHEGQAGFAVGALGTELLRQLPPFAVDNKDVLHLTEGAWDFCDEVLIADIKNNPLLMPIFEVPARWTAFRRPVQNSRVEARLVLSRRPEVEKAVSDAVSAGQMERVIDALSWLEGTRFTINRPVHEFIFRWVKKKRPATPKGPSGYEWRSIRRSRITSTISIDTAWSGGPTTNTATRHPRWNASWQPWTSAAHLKSGLISTSKRVSVPKVCHRLE